MLLQYLGLEPYILYDVFVYGLCALMLFIGILIARRIPRSCGMQRKRYMTFTVVAFFTVVSLVCQKILEYKQMGSINIALISCLVILFCKKHRTQ